MPRLALLLVVLALPACSEAGVEREVRLAVTVDGAPRSAILIVPGDVPAPAPLVLVLHGFTSNGRAVRETSEFDRVARDRGFLVVYPQASGFVPAWKADPLQGDTDVRFLEGVIAAAAAEHPVGAVFVVGFSNGGGMALRMGCERPDLVAAVAVVSAAIRVPCTPRVPVPLLAFHGTGDRIVPYAGAPGIAAVEDWVGVWTSGNGCRSRIDAQTAPGVTVHRGTECAAPVGLYEIDGGGHGWPGSSHDPWWGSSTDVIDASALIGEFFAAYGLSG